MKLQTITITDWGPFKGRQTFRFPEAPGLYFLWGRNEVDVRLGSNGSGKSRLWEALCWVIFGKTSRGLKAGETANWDVGRGASVSLAYCYSDDDETSCVVTRSWSPNSWTWVDAFGATHDLAKDETNPLLDDLRLSFQAFLNVILMSQEGVMFLDLKAEAKAALFGEVLGLDRWLEASQKAAKKAADEDVRCRRLDREVAKIEGQLEQMREASQGSGTDQQQAWDSEQRLRLRGMADAYEVLLDKYGRAVAEAQAADQREDAARAKLKAATTSLKELKQQRAKHTEVVSLAMTAVARDQAELRRLESHLHFLEEHDHCPTCDQDLDPKLKAEQLREAKNQVKARATILAESSDRLEAARDDTDEHDAKIEKQERRVREAQGDVDDANHKARSALRDSELFSRDLDDLDDQIDREQARVNPFIALAAEAEQKEQALMRQLREARRLLDDADSRHRLFTSWVKWFKEIRLGEIAEAMTQLEIEVNNELSALGLTTWALRFEVDRETKSGSIQRGFTVTVVSPHNPRPVPWEAWSGGEAQRLRLAAQCGLANLIRSSLGVTLPIEAWDEPTDGMSPQGISDLLQSLSARAQAEQRQIWIIDHHSLNFGGFAGTSGVIKTKAGSVFDQADLYISSE